ncbi:MAG: hypothetical protein JWO36_4454 [Myxococcales bacterium]|nr:hypothetical protein [Myxococcales bacterium]
MIHHPNRTRVPEVKAEPAAPDTTWPVALAELLTRAAAMCVEHDIDVDAFMRSAWSAYLEARPGMREYLEEMQLRNQLDEYRKSGRMGKA